MNKQIKVPITRRQISAVLGRPSEIHRQQPFRLSWGCSLPDFMGVVLTYITHDQDGGSAYANIAIHEGGLCLWPGLEVESDLALVDKLYTKLNRKYVGTCGTTLSGALAQLRAAIEHATKENIV